MDEEMQLEIKDSVKEEILLFLIKKDRFKASELIVSEFFRHYVIYTTRHDEKPEMYIYNGAIFIPQGKSYLEQFVRIILTEAYTTQFFNMVYEKVKIDSYIDEKILFRNQDKWKICLLNGVLDLKTKKLKPFHPDYMFFNQIPVTYNIECINTNTRLFLGEILNDSNEVKIMQELLGHILLREYKIEKMFMFEGKGRNGKSKWVEYIKRFVGIDNCSSIQLQDFEKDIYSASELHHKLVNIGGDLNSTSLKETGIIKSLTGRDLVSSARKYQTRLNFQNYAQMLFLCNELPISYDNSEGFWDRWIYICFNKKFLPKKEIDLMTEEFIEENNIKLADPDIINNLVTEEELSGTLNWAIEGLHRLLKNGDYSYNKTREEVKKIWTRKANSVLAFIDECIEEDFDGKIDKEQFRKEYSQFCKKHNATPKSEIAIKTTLSLQCHVWETQETEELTRKRIRYWNGIRLK